MKNGSNKGWSQLWKRNAVVAAVALFVCAAVYLNWDYEQQAQAGKTLGESTLVGGEAGDPLLESGAEETGGTSDVQTGQAAQSDYFATARLNRQQARDSALSLLQQAASGENADQTMIDQANESIQTMADYTVTEAEIENLITAKGYTDCVAFMGEDSLSLAVAAPEGGLTESDTARIVDMVNQAAGYTAAQIKIIEVEE